MSLDRLQSKPGSFQISPEPDFLTTGTNTSSPTYQKPGGLFVGGIGAGFAAASTSLGGGAVVVNAGLPGVSTYQVMATGGTITHGNQGVVCLSASVTANNLQLEPPSFPGQLLVLDNRGATSCSVGSLGTVTLPGATASTTALVNAAAFSIAASGKKILYASPVVAAAASTNWPNGVWVAVA